MGVDSGDERGGGNGIASASQLPQCHEGGAADMAAQTVGP